MRRRRRALKPGTITKILILGLVLMPLLGAFECGQEEHRLFDTLAESQQQAPIWSPDGTRLMYGESANLFLVEADGSRPQRLFERPLMTRCCEGDFSPSISPDGTKVAFATMRERSGIFSSFGGVSFGIGISALDGSGYRMLTKNDGLFTNPVWSPDGSRIATQSAEYHGSIYTMAADGSDIQRISPPSLRPTKDPPVWSPDGNRIAFRALEGDSDATVLYTVSADGTDLRRVSVTSVRPTWSPDGGLLAFAVAVGRPRLASKFYTARPDGSDLKQVAELDLLRLRSVSSLIWSLDGSWFLFAGTEYTRRSDSLLRNDAALYALRTDGSLTRKLTILDGNRISPLIALSPDGSRIAVRDTSASTSGDVVLYTMALDGSDKKILLRWGGSRG